MILILDNYDSFTYNLAQAFGRHDTVLVRRNDEVTVDDVARLAPDGIVISPGPGRPDTRRDFGICSDVLTSLSRRIPTLGVCLGHQGIAQAFGGRVVRARRAVHGKRTPITHDGRGLFRGIPSPTSVVRYHSLIVHSPSVPDCLEVTARCGDEVMGLRHRELPILGVQFHPESIGTPHGETMIENFVEMTRKSVPA